MEMEKINEKIVAMEVEIEKIKRKVVKLENEDTDTTLRAERLAFIIALTNEKAALTNEKVELMGLSAGTVDYIFLGIFISRDILLDIS